MEIDNQLPTNVSMAIFKNSRKRSCRDRHLYVFRIKRQEKTECLSDANGNFSYHVYEVSYNCDRVWYTVERMA